MLVVTAGVESNGSEESKTGGRGQRWGPRRFVFFRTGQVYVISVNSGGFKFIMMTVRESERVLSKTEKCWIFLLYLRRGGFVSLGSLIVLMSSWEDR